MSDYTKKAFATAKAFYTAKNISPVKPWEYYFETGAFTLSSPALSLTALIASTA